MNRYALWSIVALALTIGPQSYGEDLCEKFRRLGGPQPVVIDGGPGPELKIRPVKHVAVKAPSRAPFGNYYFHEDGESYAIRVFAGGKEDLLIRCDDKPYRPMTAAWINARLLYVEMSNNPRVAVQWIVNVETGKVVLNEIEHDGVQAWQHCFPNTPVPERPQTK